MGGGKGMQTQKRKKLVNGTAIVLSLAIAVLSAVCVGARLPSALGGETTRLQLMAAGLTMPDGTVKQQENPTAPVVSTIADANQAQKAESAENSQKEEESVPKKKDSDGHEGERTFPVIESQYGASGIEYDNFSIRNTTDYVINIGQQLQLPLGFEMENTAKPQVLVVHTHTGEAYMQEDLGYYYENYNGRDTDDNYNITRVGATIVDTLNAHGIGALHSTTHHDDPSYNGSYDRSAETIYSYLEKYPTIKVVIDLHRDAIGYGGESGKIKPTFVANGKKAAQIMIMSGYDPTGAYGFSHWEYNLRFALRLQQTAETLYPGMTRPLYFGDFAYNMSINTGSLLIEVGTDVNTLDEAVYSGELLGEVLAQVLKPA